MTEFVGEPEARRASCIYEKLRDNGDMRELFLWKYKDISREQVNDELKSFTAHNLTKSGELDEHEAMMLLEHRGCAKTAVELRALLTDIDKDQSHSVNFLEWLCFWFKKSYDDLNDFVDEDARDRAYAEAAAAGEAAQIAQEKIEAAKLAEEEAARKRAEEIEAESKLTGVAGATAFFKRAALDSADKGLTNEEKIKAEAARRKELREAKKAQAAALEAALKQQSAADVAKELVKEKTRVAAAEAAAEAERQAKEKAERKARKEALNAAFLAKVNSPK
jgi:hypothetical protein